MSDDSIPTVEDVAELANRLMALRGFDGFVFAFRRGTTRIVCHKGETRGLATGVRDALRDERASRDDLDG